MMYQYFSSITCHCTEMTNTLLVKLEKCDLQTLSYWGGEEWSSDRIYGSGLERLFKVLYNPLHIGYLKSPYNPDADGISMIVKSGQDTRWQPWMTRKDDSSAVSISSSGCHCCCCSIKIFTPAVKQGVDTWSGVSLRLHKVSIKL